jgi:DNA polymerase III epsilon subunit family exonuclease
MLKSFSKEAIDLLDKPLNEIEFVVFDFETTGICPAKGDRIIEIGAIKILPEFKISKNKFHRLINTDKKISKESYEIHKISKNELMYGEDECVAIYDFIDFTRGCVLVAHDSKKDMAFLKYSMKDYHVELPFEIVIDTLTLSRKFTPFSAGHSLDVISERFNIKINSSFKRHRALFDAELTAKFFRLAVKKIFNTQCFTLFEFINYLDKRRSFK